jgi:hypothetical protein
MEVRVDAVTRGTLYCCGVATTLGQHDDQLAAIDGIAFASKVAAGDQSIDELAGGLLGDA